MTDKDIRKAIREKFKNSREFAVIEEVCATTGFDNNYNVPRRIDMLVINCFKCNGFYIESIEIKVSKSDLKRELNDPKKHEVFFEDVDFYSLAIPSEMLDETKDMIPDNWGILVIDENGKARYKRKPRLISFHSGYYHKVVNRGFFASVIRAVLRQQGDNVAIKNGIHDVEIPHGEWKFVQRGNYVDMVCPFCGYMKEDSIAYGYTPEEVIDSIKHETFSYDLPNFCEECGADMKKKEGEAE